jgi:hypothetical protein
VSFTSCQLQILFVFASIPNILGILRLFIYLSSLMPD